jgi:ATP-binding cassette subfamily B protein
MEQGRLVQQGHHRDLVAVTGPYRRLWEREQAERLEPV